jgi:hypothetical protein
MTYLVNIHINDILKYAKDLPENESERQVILDEYRGYSSSQSK